MYKQTVKLEDHESLIKLNKKTGVETDLKKVINHLPVGTELNKKKSLYHQVSDDVAEYLENRLTLTEYRVVGIMSRMASFRTNSLKPLDDDTSTYELQEYLKVDRKKVKDILKKLYLMGVYGIFKVSERDNPYKHYWILNPYISSKGNITEKDVKDLFKGTDIALHHFKCTGELN